MTRTDFLIGANLALALIAPQSLCAAVVETAPNGFAITETVHVKATPDKVYQTLLHPASWWNSQHTFSGSAANLTLDARAGGCLCESLPNGGSVLHLTIVYADPGKTLRFRGPMGPFQGQGVDGALTFTLKAEPGGTLLTLDNTVGGYVKGGFGKWPALADAMLTDLVTRLAHTAETAQRENAMTLVLHAFPRSPRAFKVLFTANHLERPYELKIINLAAGEQRTPEFAALNVNQRMPVLEEDGYRLWESNAIIEYLTSKKPEAGLIPQEIKARLQVTKWLYWESAHWDQAMAIFMFERVVKKMFGRGEESPAEIARGTELFHRLAKVLDGELGKHRYVAGDALTAADLAIAPPLSYSELAGFPLEDYRAIQRWAEDMKSLPGWKKTIAQQQA